MRMKRTNYLFGRCSKSDKGWVILKRGWSFMAGCPICGNLTRPVKDHPEIEQKLVIGPSFKRYEDEDVWIKEKATELNTENSSNS